METEEIISELRELIERWTKFIERNNKVIEEMEMYIAYWLKQEVKDRFKEAVDIFMGQNKIAIEEKMECLKQLNEMEQSMYHQIAEGIINLK